MLMYSTLSLLSNYLGMQISMNWKSFKKRTIRKQNNENSADFIYHMKVKVSQLSTMQLRCMGEVQIYVPFLYLDISLWVISFMAQPIYSLRMIPCTHCVRCCVDFRDVEDPPPYA
jgi:hypothetical protein